MATPNESATAAAAKLGAEQSTELEPIVIKMGKKSRRQVRKLRRGKPGRLMNRLEETLDHLRANGALDAQTQPVVIVVREKPKRKGRRIAKAWGLG
jgi:phosphoglycolate phosphatase-like HAD superfamily hydrolase